MKRTRHDSGAGSAPHGALRRRGYEAATGSPRDPWHAFCDAMDRVHGAQAACRSQVLAIQDECARLVAAALADQPINPSTDPRRRP
jgi:hypothetical protein